MLLRRRDVAWGRGERPGGLARVSFFHGSGYEGVVALSGGVVDRQEVGARVQRGFQERVAGRAAGLRLVKKLAAVG